MFPTPKGYISLPDAVDRIVLKLHGEPKEIPWRGDKLDQETLDRGRAKYVDAQDLLVGELAKGVLVAVIGGVELPTEYWKHSAAHTTASTGLLQPPEIGGQGLAAMAYQPCFIDRLDFEQNMPVKPRVVAKAESFAAFQAFCEGMKESEGRSPTIAEGDRWGKDNGYSRDRMREMRRRKR